MGNKIKDYIYLIFVSLVLFIAGAIIIGGIKYFIGISIGIDFVSIIIYYLLSAFLTRQILKYIRIRNTFVSIYLPLLTGIMYILSQYVAFIIIYTVMGYPFIEVLKVIPEVMVMQVLSYFTSFSLSVDGIFGPIINILILLIEILVMVIGIYQSYKVTRRE